MDVNWSVNFEITVNGEEFSFDELPEEAKEHILRQIKEDYYYGTFYHEED